MAISPVPLSRTIRAIPGSWGWYFRPSCVDHCAIADVVARGSVGVDGIVFDPLREERDSELCNLMLERNFDAVLDPRTQELGPAGRFNERLSALPWTLDRPRRSDDLDDASVRRMADRMVQFIFEKHYTAALAPTHHIESANSPRLDVDPRSTMLLLHYLDRGGAGNVPVFYSLAISYDVFRKAGQRGAIVERLASLPVTMHG